MRRISTILVTSLFALAACQAGEGEDAKVAENAAAPAAENAAAPSAGAAPAAGAPAPAVPVTGSPKEITEAREEQFERMSKMTKAIHDELKKDQPSLALVRDNATKIESLAGQIPSWFPDGTGPESGEKTEALPTVWNQRPKFNQSASDLAGTARALAAAASSGDLARTRTAMGEMGKTCKACHDVFREKK